MIYYISTSGDNLNSGTSTGTPWATFTYAMSQMSSGDELRVLDGSYNQKIIPISDIKITGHSTPTSAIIRGISGVNHIIDISGVSNVIISNLHVSYNPAHSNPPLSGNTIRNYWINIGVTANNILIDNITINKTSVNSINTAVLDWKAKYRERGIHTQGSNIEIRNCNIRGVNTGILVKGSGTNIYIHDNDIYEVVQSCIVSQDSNGTVRYLRIENNHLHDAYTEDGIQFQDPPIKGDIATIGAIVKNNYIYGNRENAIDLKGASDIVIENNILFGNIGSSDETQNQPNRLAAGAIARGSGSGSQYIIVRNNAIYDNHKGIKLTGNGMKVYHNDIIYNNHDYTGSDSTYIDPNGLEFLEIDNQYTGDVSQGLVNNILGGAKNGSVIKIRSNDIKIDNNLYFPYTDGATVKYNYYGSSPTEYTGLAAWQAFLSGQFQITGNDVNSNEVNSFANIEYATLLAKPDILLDLSDFNKDITSPAYQTGIALTTVVSQSTANSFTVSDASWFSRYFNDIININGMLYVITGINYSTNTITVSTSITVTSGDEIFWAQSTPNIGILGDPSLITASFTMTNDGNCSPTLVTFNDTSTATNGVTDWLWDFGDGVTSTLQNPTHTYTVAGNYTIVLSVTSVDGIDTTSQSLIVNECESFNCDDNNILINSNFVNNVDNWILTPPAGAMSNLAWEVGKAKVTTTTYSTGTLDLSQFDINIINGQEYQLSFDVYTLTGQQSLLVRLRTAGSPYTTNGIYDTFLVNTTPQTIITTFTAEFDDPAARLMFIMNYVDTTYITNICLVPNIIDNEPIIKLPSINNQYSINTIGTITLKNAHPSWIDLFPTVGLNLMGNVLISYNIFTGLGQAIETVTGSILSWNIDTGAYTIDKFDGSNIKTGIDIRLAQYGLLHPIQFGVTRGQPYWDEYYVTQNLLYGVNIEAWPSFLDQQYIFTQGL